MSLLLLLHMLIGDESVVNNINRYLPEQIRVLGMLTCLAVHESVLRVIWVSIVGCTVLSQLSVRHIRCVWFCFVEESSGWQRDLTARTTVTPELTVMSLQRLHLHHLKRFLKFSVSGNSFKLELNFRFVMFCIAVPSRFLEILRKPDSEPPLDRFCLRCRIRISGIIIWLHPNFCWKLNL